MGFQWDLRDITIYIHTAYSLKLLVALLISIKRIESSAGFCAGLFFFFGVCLDKYET